MSEGAVSEEMCVLEAIMVEEGDLDLFPPNVVEIFKTPRGPLRAHAALKAANKKESNAARKKRQAELLAELRLWAIPVASAPSMYTMNGIGTRVYGSHQPRDDGTAISVHWFVFVFIPMVPLGSYLCLSEGDSYQFFAQTPKPPGTWMAPAGWGSLVALIAAFVGFQGFMDGRTADVIAYNGYSQPVEIRTENATIVVPERFHRSFELSADEHIVQIAFEGEDEPFEEQVLDLRSGGHGKSVYNISGRALLLKSWVTYGSGTERPEEMLTDVLSSHDVIHYPFRDPPEMLEMSSSGTTRSMLVAVDPPDFPIGAISWLIGNDEPESAKRLGYASLREPAVGVDVVAVLANLDDEPLRPWCDRVRAAYTTNVEVHRYCQTMGQEAGWDDLVPTYEAALAADPQSAFAHYLLARIVEPKRTRELLDEALVLDPDFAYANVALGYHHQTFTGDFEAALAAYERVLELGQTSESLAATELVRTLGLLGRPHPDLEWLRAHDPSDLSSGDMWEIQDDPSTFPAHRERLEQTLVDLEPDYRAHIIGTAAQLAGDQSALRELVGQGADLGLMLALSEDATPSDALSEIPVREGRAAVLSFLHATETGRDVQPHIDALSGFPKVVALLVEDAYPRASVEAAVRDTPGDLHAAVWFAAWRRTGDRSFKKEAKRWAVPPELPYFR